MNPLRVGFVVYGSPDQLSGGYRYDRELARALRSRGHAVEFLAPEALTPLAALVGRFDLLLLDELCHPSLYRIVPRISVPTIAVVHHLACEEALSFSRRLRHRRMERRFLEAVDARIANTRSTLASATRLAGTSADDRVVYPGRDGTSPSPGVSGPPLLLSVGNLIPRKGVETVLQALRILARRGQLPRDFRYRIAGDDSVDPDHARRLRRIAARIDARIEFTGRLGNDELGREFAEAGIFCLPSDHEGFGIVYLEAMGAGLPVIGTRSGGAKEIVRHGGNGFLVEPGRPRELAARLGALIGDSHLRDRMGRSARESWEAWPVWERSMAAGVDGIEEFVSARA